MLRIREFEERVKRTFTEHPGVIRGHTHLADGVEASIVGSLCHFRSGDAALATYRCHGYPLVLGSDPKAMMAEVYGRVDGLCKGLGGSMHLTDVKRGFLGTSGIVGAGIPHAAGAAWAAQIRKKGEVVYCFFGDGASKQGAFHETLNIASLWKLPVIFVMENNGYNAVTTSAQEDANAANGEPLAVKAKAYSMPGVTVDGADPLAVYATVGAAVERARRCRPDAHRIEGLPAVSTWQHHRPARRTAPLSGARGDHRVRQARGVRGGTAWRPRAALSCDPRQGQRAKRCQSRRASCRSREGNRSRGDVRRQ
jgi:pyruvate dehydrogenase E1 component alpha subunit